MAKGKNSRRSCQQIRGPDGRFLSESSKKEDILWAAYDLSQKLDELTNECKIMCAEYNLLASEIFPEELKHDANNEDSRIEWNGRYGALLDRMNCTQRKQKCLSIQITELRRISKLP